jgi:hypothetical protein
MIDHMKEVGLVLLGAVAGALATFVIEKTFPNIRRRLLRSPGVRVAIDTNPGQFLANGPNWDPFAYWFPVATDGLDDPPSDLCRDWYSWALNHGGFSALWSRTRLILTGGTDATVLIDRFDVSVVRRDLPSAGTLTICRTGGADAVPQGIQVELDADTPGFSWVDTGGDRSYSPIGLTLSKGELDVLEVEARATEPGLYEWTATLSFVENGRRREVTIDDAGKPLLLVGGSSSDALEWSGDSWQPIAL